MDRQRDFRSKVIGIKRLIRIIKPGNRIFLSSGPAWPAHSLKGILEEEEVRYFDLEFIQLFSISDLASLAEIKTNFRHISFRTGEAIPEAIAHHKSIDFIPANLMEIPFMFENGTVNVDMAIITASPPDSRGYMSLGVAIDVARIVIRKAGIVVVEVNPNMPVTYGDTSIHVDQADYFIESQEPLPERSLKAVDPVLDRIG
jgi:acyl-CoA hydrolase